jgi:hypothetical protein
MRNSGPARSRHFKLSHHALSLCVTERYSFLQFNLGHDRRVSETRTRTPLSSPSLFSTVFNSSHCKHGRKRLSANVDASAWATTTSGGRNNSRQVCPHCMARFPRDTNPSCSGEVIHISSLALLKVITMLENVTHLHV